MFSASLQGIIASSIAATVEPEAVTPTAAQLAIWTCLNTIEQHYLLMFPDVPRCGCQTRSWQKAAGILEQAGATFRWDWTPHCDPSMSWFQSRWFWNSTYEGYGHIRSDRRDQWFAATAFGLSTSYGLLGTALYTLVCRLQTYNSSDECHHANFVWIGNLKLAA